jgi:hypothetical protein
MQAHGNCRKFLELWKNTGPGSSEIEDIGMRLAGQKAIQYSSLPK